MTGDGGAFGLTARRPGDDPAADAEAEAALEAVAEVARQDRRGAPSDGATTGPTDAVEPSDDGAETAPVADSRAAEAIDLPATEEQPAEAPAVERDDASGADADGGRPIDARLARVHLRTGLLGLARAELEALASLDRLDTTALADLAEARWRSGDLLGGGEAAHAHLQSGGGELIAAVVAAEALYGEGRIRDSRRLAALVMEQAGPDLERLLAGQSRSPLWGQRQPRPAHDGTPAHARADAEPAAATSEASPAETGSQRPATASAGTPATKPVDAAASVSSADAVADRPRAVTPGADATSADRVVPGHPTGPSTTGELVDAGRAAGRELDAIEEAIERRDLSAVAERMALLLRVDRALAPVILSLVERALALEPSSPHTIAALLLVRGDAYRILGHEAEAGVAYEESRHALEAGRAAAPQDPRREVNA